MMYHEFLDRTGINVTLGEYEEVIEQMYYDFDGNKDEFCKDFVDKNRMQEVFDMRLTKIEKLRSALLEIEKSYSSECKKLENEVESLKAQLEKEQEWKPYEMHENVPQSDYEKLAASADGNCAHYMTDEEAIQWICDEFDFDPAKVTIVHEIDEWEINRHNQLRKTGNKIDRRPVYCATDYHYIRFNTSRWYYEVWNDTLRPYYC